MTIVNSTDRTIAMINSVTMDDAGSYTCEILDAFGHGTRGTTAIAVVGE